MSSTCIQSDNAQQQPTSSEGCFRSHPLNIAINCRCSKSEDYVYGCGNNFDEMNSYHLVHSLLQRSKVPDTTRATLGRMPLPHTAIRNHHGIRNIKPRSNLLQCLNRKCLWWRTQRLIYNPSCWLLLNQTQVKIKWRRFQGSPPVYYYQYHLLFVERGTCGRDELILGSSR